MLHFQVVLTLIIGRFPATLSSASFRSFSLLICTSTKAWMPLTSSSPLSSPSSESSSSDDDSLTDGVFAGVLAPRDEVERKMSVSFAKALSMSIRSSVLISDSDPFGVVIDCDVEVLALLEVPWDAPLFVRFRLYCASGCLLLLAFALILGFQVYLLASAFQRVIGQWIFWASVSVWRRRFSRSKVLNEVVQLTLRVFAGISMVSFGVCYSYLGTYCLLCRTGLRFACRSGGVHGGLRFLTARGHGFRSWGHGWQRVDTVAGGWVGFGG